MAMAPLKDNEDVACFLVTKHSWKGRYKRIFSVGSMGISTYNPSTLEITNKWSHNDIVIQPTTKAPNPSNEFVLSMKKNDSMKFSSDQRPQLLTEALKFKYILQKPRDVPKYSASKYHWSDTKLPVLLEVTPFSLDQLDPTTNAVLASYCYKDIEGMAEVKDHPGGFVVVSGGFGRMHLFSSLHFAEICKKMLDAASANIGICIKFLKCAIVMDEFLNQRFGKFSGDENVTSVSEFNVHKIQNCRHSEPQKRILCLSESCLLERDPQTYSICTLRPLSDIFSLIRKRENPQEFTVEYVNGNIRTYTATDRDSLLASLLDGVRASGNRDVHVKMTLTPKGKRIGPLCIPVEEEVESHHLKFLQQPPGKRSFTEVVERFNANIPYSGLLHSVTQDHLFAENKEKLILGALNALVQKEGDQNTITLHDLEGQFHALRRLVASKYGFAAFTQMAGFRESVGLKVVKALKREDESVTHAAIDMICALMHPMHDDYDLRQEQLNKSSLLSSQKFLESLLEMWIGHVTLGTGALVVSAMLDYLTFALCVPYCETTDGKHFDNLLEMVADHGRSLFRLFQHPSLAVVKGAGLVMRAVIEEGEPEVAARMQDLALAEGALPRHLLTALFAVGSDGRLLAHRQLSRHLVGLWVTGHPTTMGLLKRIMPSGLLTYLDSKDKVPASAIEQEMLNNRDNLCIAQDYANRQKRGPQWAAIERQIRMVEKRFEHAFQHWGERLGLERKEDRVKERPIVLRKRRERIKSEANWQLFYFKFNEDHALPNLIWNHKMKELWQQGAINGKTKCWAQGMDGWRTLQQVPQLKWCLMAKGNPVMNESELATLILNILIKMCEYFPSRDSDDAIIRPLPKVKRFLSDQVCLPHLVQLVLTFDPVLVEKIAILLCEVMKDNPAISMLYSTGVFYFILMYTGSNVLPIANFLKLTHIKQALRGSDYQLSEIMKRSILGQLLPEAMVSYLENHGAEKFAQIYLGEFDTPEAIWNTEMRRMLIEKVAAHIADFSPRLRSNTRAIYTFCPIPVVRYPQLEQELFCNIFYLRHLCDTTRFPEWPIQEPVKLLKDVLDTWKKEVEKKPPEMSVDDAYEILNLRRGVQHEESSARKAYYRLAQQFHPDKNPEGRDKFEKVSKAYEFLCSRSVWTTQGPNPNNIVLILQTQSILFHRYSTELQPYKYAGYPQLVRTIQLETNDDQLFSKSAPLLSAASELAYHTVHCSALNAEELRRERGLDVLLEAYSRCVSVLNASSKPNEVSVQVCTHITKCFRVAAQFQGCRDKMVEMSQLVRDLCHILFFKHLTKLCAVATECVSALAVDSILQMQLMQAGVLWHILLFLFNYDFTLEEGGVERSEDANQQEMANKLAKLAVTACARLGGYLPGELKTPENPVTISALNALITPFLAQQLRKNKPAEILKILNSNSESPYLIWDNGTRTELCEFLECQRQNKLDNFDDGDPSCPIEFSYSTHKEELIIGGIFVRIYNQQPTYCIENPKGFIIDLLEFLASQSEHLASVGSNAIAEEDKVFLQRVVMALEALGNLVRNNPGVEMQCIGHFPLLFGLLNVDYHKSVQQKALEVISSVTRNQECVNDIAASDVLVYLLLVLYSIIDAQITVLDTLYALMSSTKIVKDSLNKGAVLYLLDLFCNCSAGGAAGVREKAAELLARMIADKLAGPRVRLAVGRFLPPAFADAMRESPQAAVHLFEGSHENPELVWDATARSRACSAIAMLREEHYIALKLNHQMSWHLPEEPSINSYAPPGELVVGGVYLRLFVDNPGWVLRKPKEFLAELMDTCLMLMTKEKPDAAQLELSAGALVRLLQAQPALADVVPALGHIPRLCRQMAQPQPAVPAAAVRVLHQLATSEPCIQALAATDCMGPLKRAMQLRADVVGVACETLNRLFSANQDHLVRQALDVEMVPYLLGLLDGQLESLENPAMTKAQIVKALKSMSRSQTHGTRVFAILEKSSVWTEYRDQRHDLFITNTAVGGCLTGAPPTTAGYLTQGITTKLPDAPPPMDKDDLLPKVDNV